MTLRGILALSDRGSAYRRLQRLAGLFPPRALAELQAWKPILIGPFAVARASDPRTARPSSSDQGTTVFKGRLDEPQSATHPERVKAFARVVEQGHLSDLEQFAGDWAFASWNAAECVVTLGVDPLSVQPLFYCVQNGIVLWSTNVDDVLAFADREVDTGYLAGLLVAAHPAGRSALKGVRFIPGGHCLRIGIHLELEIRRYWRLAPRHHSNPNPATAAEELRDLLDQAVTDRLVPGTDTCFELSGGLDSSTLVSLGRRRAGAAGAAPPVSLTFRSVESPEYDEERFIAAVRQRYPGPHLCFYLERFPRVKTVHAHTPRGAFQHRRAAHRLLRRMGIGLIVSGRGGDAVMGNWGEPRLWLLQRYGSAAIGQRLRDLENWAVWKKETVWRILANTYRHWHAHKTGHASDLKYDEEVARYGSVSAALQQAFLLTTTSVALVQANTVGLFPDYTRDLEPPWWMLAADLYYRAAYGSYHTIDWRYGIAHTYPYLDNRLLSFVVSLPARVVSGPYAPRALMRQAFQGIVPSAVLGRRGKGYAAPAVTRMMTPVAARLLSELPRLKIVEYDLVDAGRLRCFCEEYVRGARTSTGSIKQIAAVESWLRAFEQAGAAANASTAWPAANVGEDAALAPRA